MAEAISKSRLARRILRLEKQSRLLSAALRELPTKKRVKIFNSVRGGWLDVSDRTLRIRLNLTKKDLK